MSWGIYCRISKDLDGSGKGVNRQEKECRKFAATNGLEVAEIYIDNDISAYSGKQRPAYEQMLKDLEEQRITGVICWHVDRLYRHSKDLESLVDIVERTGAEIRTLKAGDLDLNTATGRMMARMVATISSYEVDHQIERQKAAHADRAARGVYRGGYIPYGYHYVSRGVIEKDEHEAAVIRMAAEHILAGKSLMSAKNKLNSKGLYTRSGAKWTSVGVRQFLLRPTSAGYATYKGEVVGKANWEPILTEDEWRALTAILTDPARRTQQGTERKWQGAGVYRCGKCGGKVYSYAGGSSKRAYMCRSCGGVSRSQVKLDEMIDELVFGYLSKPENQLTIVSGKKGEGADMTALVAKRSQLVERKNQLGAMFAQGIMDQAQVIRGNQELELELKKLDRQLQQAREKSPLVELVLGEKDIRKRWPELNPDQRAEVIRTLMDVVIMPGRSGPKFDPSLIKVTWKE